MVFHSQVFWIYFCRREYQNLKDTIAENCDIRRKFCLRASTFYALKEYCLKQRNWKIITATFMRTKNQHLKETTFSILHSYRLVQCEKKLNREKATLFQTNILVSKYFHGLHRFTHVYKVLKENYNEIVKRTNHRLMLKCMVGLKEHALKYLYFLNILI
jgi:hypothetical protein